MPIAAANPIAAGTQTGDYTNLAAQYACAKISRLIWSRVYSIKLIEIQTPYQIFVVNIFILFLETTRNNEFISLPKFSLPHLSK